LRARRRERIALRRGRRDQARIQRRGADRRAPRASGQPPDRSGGAALRRAVLYGLRAARSVESGLLTEEPMSNRLTLALLAALAAPLAALANPPEACKLLK